MSFSEIMMSVLPWCSIALLLFSLVFGGSLFGYEIVYRRWMRGKQIIPMQKFLIIAILCGYVFIVFGITNFSRADVYIDEVNMSLFSGYLEFANTGTLRSLQMLLFNILMFMPLGILLPLMSESLRSFGIVLLLSLIFSFTIETVQLANNTGIFELDDLFNNTLGGILGYLIHRLFFEPGGIRRKLSTVIHTLSIFFSFGNAFSLPGFIGKTNDDSYKQR